MFHLPEMAAYDKDEVPMLSDTHPQVFDDNGDSRLQAFASRIHSASISIPMNSLESWETETTFVGYTGPLRSERKAPSIQMSGPLYINRRSGILSQQNNGVAGGKKEESKAEKYPSFSGIDNSSMTNNRYHPRNEHLLRSGQLGTCNDPCCTTCPTYYNSKVSRQTHSKSSRIFDHHKFHNALYGDAKGWAKRFKKAMDSYIPGVMNPHAKDVQRWNKFFVISCLVAIFLDPLFFFLLSVQEENKCIVIDWAMTKAMVVFRSMTDAIYLLNMLLQFRLAYVAPESMVVGAGELVDHPKKIAQHYLRGCFFVDLFVVLPLPQIIVLLFVPKVLGSSGANYAKNLLRAAILVQYIPRLFRFLPLLIGHSPSGFIFETAWPNFFINLITFVLAGHLVGSCWYLFGLQRVNQCFRDACRSSGIPNCLRFTDCGQGTALGDSGYNSPRDSWKKNANAAACFDTASFHYGIYVNAVNLTTKDVVTRYIYSLFWGFQQINTLAGNQTPTYFVWEVLFIGPGLLLFAFLIGNMQNFLQALGRRRLEMSLRQRDVEQWMSHRRLPQDLRRKVLEAERYNWAATRGVHEGSLLENLPEDLQREIRRHLFKFVKEVWIFNLVDEHVLDSICERLRQNIYIKGSEILYHGGLVDKMTFVVRGKMESIGEDGTIVPLSEGNVCGEELLTWCLEHSSVSKDGKKIKVPGQRLVSSRIVRCLTNVEAFSLRAADLEEVTSIFARSLRNPLVQGAIRYKSPYWRAIAATRIQVAWRYRQKRLKRSGSSNWSNSV